MLTDIVPMVPSLLPLKKDVWVKVLVTGQPQSTMKDKQQ
jgi:hypothetical protein